MDACTVQRFVVSELLCYYRCKVGNLSINTLRGVIYDFYKPIDITVAKELLVDIVDELNVEKWQKPAKRKASDNKTRVEVEDIISVFTFLDESLMLDKLPTFVAVNVDNIPSNRIEEGDIRCILNKLEGMDKKLDTFPCQLADSFDKHNVAVPRAPVPPPAINLRHGGPRRGPGPVAGTSGNLWSEMVKTPRGVDDTGGKAGESGDVDSDNHMSCNYKFVLCSNFIVFPGGC